MNKAAHPNVLKAKELIEKDGQQMLVMDLAERGSLASLISNKGLSERKMKPIVRQILAALAHLESKEIVHLDIKPENILLNKKGNPLLCDFGASLEYEHFKLLKKSDKTGTPYYMSPEMNTGNWSKMHKSDIYSLGLTVKE